MEREREALLSLAIIISGLADFRELSNHLQYVYHGFATIWPPSNSPQPPHTTVLVLRMANRKWKDLSNSQACCLAQLCLGAA